MSVVTIPPELASLLGQLREPTELRDKGGNLLGLFTPQGGAEGGQPIAGHAHFSLEEAERLWEEQRHLPGHTLEEIWRELKRG